MRSELAITQIISDQADAIIMRYSILILTLFLACIASHHAVGDELESFDPGAHVGEVVVLDFWASWCGPCRDSFPWLNAMQQKYADAGLTIIGVNVDDDRAEAERFLSKIPATFDIVYDPQGVLASQYQLLGMPSTVIFNRAGEVVSKHHGFKVKRQQEYEDLIKQVVLAE